MSTLIRGIEDLAALGRGDADQLADWIIDAVITELRRDASLPARSAADWNIALADLRRHLAEHIHRRTHDHVDRDDVIRLLEERL